MGIIYRLFNEQLEQDIKSRCNPHLQNEWKLKYSAIRGMHVWRVRCSILCTPTDNFDKTQLMYSTILLRLFVSTYDIIASRLNYSTVFRNKFKYINM